MSARPDDSTAAAPAPVWRALATEMLGYWEPRRLFYNAVLATVVAVRFAARWPHSKAALGLVPGLILFVLAMLANILYCAAYAVDAVVQSSEFRPAWLRMRWVLLLLGTALAAVLAYFVTLAAFGAK